MGESKVEAVILTLLNGPEVATLALLPYGGPMTHKIILDTDPGIDDAMAILFAEAHPAIDLLAITTVFGNATIENGTRNALWLKQKYGMKAEVA